MGKIIRLTESDLIKLVKRMINEQPTTDERPLPSDRFKDYFLHRTDGSSKFEDKTVNLYSDKQEKSYAFKYIINKIEGTGNRLIIYGISDGGRRELNFNFSCTGGRLLPVEKGDIELYNSKFVQALRKEFCTTGSGGSQVPKADFSSNNKQNTTNSDLV
jgi:hypothetical protein